jgi:hypothetical protein
MSDEKSGNNSNKNFMLKMSKQTINTFILLIFIGNCINTASAQKPKNGIYTYQIAFAEWGGKSLGATCTVIIKGDRIKVLHNGTRGLSGSKGEILDSGIIVLHKSGKWIIGHSIKDKNAKEIGGCSDGPTVIDFKRKKWWTC